MGTSPRSKTPIGIQVVWRGWLKLHDDLIGSLLSSCCY